MMMTFGSSSLGLRIILFMEVTDSSKGRMREYNKNQSQAQAKIVLRIALIF
jgi:hypothetical protein